MKKVCKKLLIMIMALALMVSALCFSSCTYSARGLDGDYSSGEVESQGGWVVKKGDYIYFINGMTTASTDADGNTVAYDNEYGDVVRGSLMRIKESDMEKGEYDSAETVVPLLFVAADYTSGIYIYGDYVYYATPTTATSITGETDSSYVDFKRSRLDGKQTMKGYYFRSDDSTAEYRFVEVDGVVYCLHMDGDDLYSYNTETGDDTMLAKSTTSHIFHTSDVTDPYVYYTMSVTEDIDQTNSVTADYNQVYRVRADATYTLDKKTASYTVTDGTGSYSYTYDFDKDSLEDIADEMEDSDTEYDENDIFKANKINTYPYVNLGELVLDGIGQNDEFSQYNHSTGDPYTPDGYTYTLIGYENGGLYYRRQYVSDASGTGETGWTYYLSEDYFNSSWNSVTDNALTTAADFGGKNEVLSLTTTNMSTSSLFYMKDNTHYYLYSDGTNICRVEVGKNATGQSDGTIAEEIVIAKDAYASEFLLLDNDSSDTYKYVYYTTSGSSSFGLARAVYDSTEAGYAGNEESYYNRLTGADEYKATAILDLYHPTEWYAPEVIDGYVFFIDTTAVGDFTFNTADVLSLKNTDTSDEVMNNAELQAYNDLYDDVQDVINDAAEFSTNTGNLVYYYYYTGDSDLVTTVIEEAIDEGYNQYSIFSADEQAYFWAYVNRTAYTKGKLTVDFSDMLMDEDGNYYGVRSYFYHFIGVLDDDDDEEVDQLEDAWRQNYLSALTDSEDDDTLPTWAWVLIGIGIGVGVIGIACAITIPLVLHNRKLRREEEGDEPRRKKYSVDMTYDEDIDVYADPAEEPQETEGDLSGEEDDLGIDFGDEDGEASDDGTDKTEE